MTKKIKIIIAIICTSVVAIASTLAILSCNNISHSMKLNKPDRIVVYYNSQINNVVFEQGDEQYNIIYSSILEGCEQNMLSAIFCGDISKSLKVTATEQTDINLKGIHVGFVYDTPQVVRYKKSNYLNNGISYWYQSLIFSIDNSSKYQYNTVAIIPPESSSEYVYGFSYNLYYSVYSNFAKLYDMLITLF